MSEREKKSLGQVAYEAFNAEYAHAPAWERVAYRASWQRAAAAVEAEVLRRQSLVRPAPAGEPPHGEEWRERWQGKTRGGFEVLAVIEFDKVIDHGGEMIVSIAKSENWPSAVMMRTHYECGLVNKREECDRDLLPVPAPSPAAATGETTPKFKAGDVKSGKELSNANVG